MQRFLNRYDAGRQLAARLPKYANRPDVLVLALPRGGVPVAYEVARALHAPLDIWIVRKLGVPGQEELALGAIASGGIRILNEEIIQALDVSEEMISRVTEREMAELRRREQAYRGDRPALEIGYHMVILVDDGLATGASMLAAVRGLRAQQPSGIIVAVPVAPIDAIDMLQEEVDQVVCVMSPEPFAGVGRWYEDFRQTTDEEVQSLLQEATQK